VGITADVGAQVSTSAAGVIEDVIEDVVVIALAEVEMSSGSIILSTTDASGAASVPTDGAEEVRVPPFYDCAGVSIDEGGVISGVGAAAGVSIDEGAGSAGNAMDGSDNGAVSNAGGAISAPTDGAGHGKVPSFSDGAMVVEGAAASVIMAAGTAVIAVAVTATV
jgi:hypothetical protein